MGLYLQASPWLKGLTSNLAQRNILKAGAADGARQSRPDHADSRSAQLRNLCLRRETVVVASHGRRTEVQDSI